MSESEEKIVKKMKLEDPPITNPTQCLAKLLMSKEMTDLTVIIPGYNDHFKVHRLVLSMWSKVFQAMLFGSMAEGDTITLVEDSPEAFGSLVSFMYTGRTGLNSIELALQVYQLANKYLIRHLQTVCSNYMIAVMSAAHVPEVFNFATLMEDESLINNCFKILGESADLFFSSPTIGKLNRDSLEQMLKTYLSVSSETIIYQGILNWGKSHLEYKKEEITPIKLRQEVDKFVPQIRFLNMTCEEFARHVLPNNIFTLKEVEAIQMSIAGVPDANLPSLFSTSMEKRISFDISHIKTCNFSDGRQIEDFPDPRPIANPDIFDQVKTKCKIYLNKVDCNSNIGYHGTLTVKDSFGRELQTTEFNGRVAVFDVPLKLVPDETYTFNLSGGESEDRYEDYYHISDNELISGRIRNNFGKTYVFYYWK